MIRGRYLLLLLAAAGCIARSARGYPLYVAAAPLGADEVSLLSGYVARVDGRDVTSLGPVELLPGCHVVETPVRWSRGSPSSGVVVATTGPLTFVLWMKAGRRYSVSLSADRSAGPLGTAYVGAEEITRDGDPVRAFGPVGRGQEGEIVACAHAGAMNTYPHAE